MFSTFNTYKSTLTFFVRGANIKNMITDIQAQELCELIKNNKENLELIDVRESSEYDEGHIECAKSIPMSEMQARVGEIDWNKDVILMCHSGGRSKYLCNIISSSMGKKLKNLSNGISGFLKDGDEKLIVKN